MKITVRGAANIIRVSARTIARALTGDVNSSLPPKYYIEANELGLIFNCDPDIFKLAHAGGPKYKLLKPNEAIIYLNISARTFQHHKKIGKIKPVLQHNKVVRYTEDYLDTIYDQQSE